MSETRRREGGGEGGGWKNAIAIKKLTPLSPPPFPPLQPPPRRNLPARPDRVRRQPARPRLVVPLPRRVDRVDVGARPPPPGADPPSLSRLLLARLAGPPGRLAALVARAVRGGERGRRAVARAPLRRLGRHRLPRGRPPARRGRQLDPGLRAARGVPRGHRVERAAHAARGGRARAGVEGEGARRGVGAGGRGGGVGGQGVRL